LQTLKHKTQYLFANQSFTNKLSFANKIYVDI